MTIKSPQKRAQIEVRRRIAKALHREGLPLREIAQKLGVSHEQIRLDINAES